MHHLHIEKKGLRGLAIAESFKENEKISHLAGVVMRLDFIIDGFVFGYSTIEGNDATDAILQMHQKLNRDDISFVMISGLIISMYNIVDIKKIWSQLKIEEYHNLGQRTKISLHTGHDVFVRIEGCTMDEAKSLLNAMTLQGAVPEPLRVAQMLAKTKLQ